MKPPKEYLRKIDNYLDRNAVKGFLQDMFHSFPIDLYETDKGLIVQAELPGITKEQITIDIQDYYMKISVENDRTLTSEKNFYYKERSFIYKERIIKIPLGLIKSQAKASFQNGILEIKIPKKPYEQQIVDIQ